MFFACICSDYVDELQLQVYQWYASFKDNYRQIISTALLGNSNGDNLVQRNADTDMFASNLAAEAAYDPQISASREEVNSDFASRLVADQVRPSLSGAAMLVSEDHEPDCSACCTAVASLEEEVRELRYRLDRLEAQRARDMS